MKTDKKQLGPILLSGLMIGPILGSGIIILPPLAYGVAGDWAILAWALMAVAGFVFAFTFARLSILYPGSAGVATAIAAAFGEPVKKLTSLYLIGAVLFGPVAVMLTAAGYLFPDSGSAPLIALPMLLVCSFLLQRRIDSIGR
ncbi:MAG TPA: amino acid permease, partial [Desulfobulbaceae bacterium]|nr:amino acid permease [Desulfobulbaceae bacterium]